MMRTAPDRPRSGRATVDRVDRRSLAVAAIVLLALPWLLGALGLDDTLDDVGPGVAGRDHRVDVATGPTPVAAHDPVELRYFGADGCPYCAQMEAFLQELEIDAGPALRIERFEVSRDPAARQRWEAEMHERGRAAEGVPTTVLDERVWVGFNDRIADEITVAVTAELDRRTAPEPGARGPIEAPTSTDTATVEVPGLGEVSLGDRSAIGVTALIAFVDGFNPCSLWVLTVLLAMVLNAGATRRRVATVGVTFLTVTGLLYGAFIVGLFTVLGFVEQLGTIRTIVAVVALVVGLINVKDYLAYKQGVSLTIPDRVKPRIYRGGRAVRDHRRSLPSVLAVTVVMAAGVALVELPCTAGFPVVWTGTLRTLGVDGGATFAALLALYLLIYVGLELLIFGAVLITLRMTRFEERHGRALKLVGGSLMLALGIAMIAAPQLLDDLTGLLAVTGGAVVLAGLLAVIGRLRGRTPAQDRITTRR